MDEEETAHSSAIPTSTPIGEVPCWTKRRLLVDEEEATTESALPTSTPIGEGPRRDEEETETSSNEEEIETSCRRTEDNPKCPPSGLPWI